MLFTIHEMRWPLGPCALLACLALAGADMAEDSKKPLPDSETPRPRAPDGEEAALCFSKLAWLPGPSQERADRRMEELAAEHPDVPWFAYQLARLRHRPDPEEAEQLYRQS